MTVSHITAAELYEAVWRKPLKALAQRWQLHPQSLGKLCDTHGIPRPPSGYWTLKARGDTPAIIPDDVFSDLQIHFNESQIVELVATVAMENYRARFNRAFMIASQGFYKPETSE